MAWRGLYVRQPITNVPISLDELEEKIQAYARRGAGPTHCQPTTAIQSDTESENTPPPQVRSESTSCEQLEEVQRRVKELHHLRRLDMNSMRKLYAKLKETTRKLEHAETQLKEKDREMQNQRELLLVDFATERAQLDEHIAELSRQVSIHEERNQNAATPGSGNRRLLDGKLECGICFDQDVSIAFSPCGHVVCAICSESIPSRCHACRKLISSRLALYI